MFYKFSEASFIDQLYEEAEYMDDNSQSKVNEIPDNEKSTAVSLNNSLIDQDGPPS